MNDEPGIGDVLKRSATTAFVIVLAVVFIAVGIYAVRFVFGRGG